MNLNIQEIQFSNSREEYKRYNLPDEDFIYVKDNAFAAFDGVTILFQNPYPNPSPARKAAEIGAQTVVENLLVNQDKVNPEELLKDSFIKANEKIKNYNESLGVTPKTVNHTSKQYAATVGSFGFIKDNILYAGLLGDCGVLVLNEKGDKEIGLDYDDRLLTEYMENFLSPSPEINFDPMKHHIYIRQNVVNNPDLEYKGKKINFAVMTGQKEAEQFLKIKSTEIKPGYTILFYSDGFTPFIEEKEFLEFLIKNKNQRETENYILEKSKTDKKYQKEKSLLLIRL
jgi:serine/threonine protein phosphatase PrpC